MSENEEQTATDPTASPASPAHQEGGRPETAPPATAYPGTADPEKDPGRRLDRLHPAAVTLWRLSSAFRGAGFVVLALAGDMIVDLPGPTGLAAFVVAVLTLFGVVLVPPARYRAWGYRLREEDLYLRHGILFRTTTIVPHARIQHVDTRHGPLDRWLGLAAVVVFTAGTRGAVIEIPALGAETAAALRDRLAALSGAGDAV